jgi:hypothetical protein
VICSYAPSGDNDPRSTIVLRLTMFREADLVGLLIDWVELSPLRQ